MEEFFIFEKRKAYPQSKILERLIHCIWSEQLFRKTMQLDGEDLAISSPGWWNLEAGPDFRSAEIFIGGRRLCGDIEIHLHSADWYHHGHHEDPRYNGVIMHVVLYKSQTSCMRQDGRQIPILELKDHLLEELRLLQQRIPIHQFPFGPEANVRLCRRFLEDHDMRAVERILDSAGDLRMKRKKDRYLPVIAQKSFHQAFYEGLMEGMGYKQSRYAFRELSQRVPLDELLQFDLSNRKGIDAMAAVLLGTAGLLDDLSDPRLEGFDPETRYYCNQILSHWRNVASRFSDRRLIGFCWYPSSTRPANFPARRLTAVAAFFHYYRQDVLALLLSNMQPADSKVAVRDTIRKWLLLLYKPLHIYWSYHFQFDHVKFSAPKRLIGKERGKILIVNVVLPSLLAWAELQKDAELERRIGEIYHSHPLLSENSVSRLMEHRLFGSKEKARIFIRSAHRQQALHHFFYDFCDNRETSCSRCELQHEPGASRVQLDLE